MPALAAMSFTGFAGYASLLPVAPLWAVHGGADAAGAGLVNGVLLLFTVATQLFVPGSLRRFGWGPVLTTGMVLLGLPALLYAVSDALAPILALSAVRGVGFGVLTVTASAAVAQLVDPRRRGEAIGAFGLSIALPNLLLLPIGPWVAQHLGFWVVFVLSALPLLGVPAARRLARVVHGLAPVVAGPGRAAYPRLLRPMVVLLSVTLAGGALVTFAPQLVDDAALTAGGLFLMGLLAAASRWRVGKLADRHGAGRFVWPLLLLTAVGMALIAWSVTDSATQAWPFLAGMGVVGLCYGALQNLTLVISFDAVAKQHHNVASAVWNVGFDSGTGLGAVVVGAVAAQTSFAVALLVAAVLVVAALPVALTTR